MKPAYLIGIDLGTSATKAALYREDGSLVAEASTEVPLSYPYPGAVEQENEDFYRSATETVRRCITESGIDARAVAAVACDSQMAGLGSVDEDYRAATRFDSWLDMRCRPYIEQLRREHGERITRLTGCPPTCDHGPKILWWKHEHPESYARVVRFLMPAAYVAGRMAGLRGEQAFMDYTFIHFSALADAEKGAWSPELCSALGVDEGKLPRIVAPWEVVGEVTEAAARHSGLAPGTPIAAGCGDTAAGALGAGIVDPGMLFDTAGTASVLAACTDRFVADGAHRALLTMRSVLPGVWHPLAYIGGGGLALRWFRDNLAAEARARAAQEGRDAYAVLDDVAAAVPAGSQGLIFLPHLGGRICPADPELRGMWAGFSWSHGVAHFYRAILESVAYEYAFYLSVLGELLPEARWTEARVVGGGARSAVWNQIKADVLGIPCVTVERLEFATWGAAMIAGHAAGIYGDLAETARRHARSAQRFEPDAERNARYRAYVQEYRELLDASAPHLRCLAAGA